MNNWKKNSTLPTISSCCIINFIFLYEVAKEIKMRLLILLHFYCKFLCLRPNKIRSLVHVFQVTTQHVPAMVLVVTDRTLKLWILATSVSSVPVQTLHIRIRLSTRFTRMQWYRYVHTCNQSHIHVLQRLHVHTLWGKTTQNTKWLFTDWRCKLL